ncbi:hypothetical protein ACEPAI_8096 [Sanghuangporus weigelae]
MSINITFQDGRGDFGLGPDYRIKKDGPSVELVSIRNRKTSFAWKFGWHTLSEIFLPSGFPDTVTPGKYSNYTQVLGPDANFSSVDYIRYQIFDSLQAFSSSIAGLLSSRAVLEGFGVGDGKASSTSAVLLSVMQDATGRLATIFFAWKFGTALAPEAKMYRLAADIFNDSAFILDCLSPALPTQPRIAALCIAGALRAICGVCGGGAKAALSVHFARAGNVGELNAKDASQETVVGLLGMLCGSLVMSHITSRPATWAALSFLLILHLVTNYLAVRAVALTTLNRQRANIAYGLYCSQEGVVPSPSEVARIERIFEVPATVRDPSSGYVLGKCTICSSAEELLHSSRRKSTTSWRDALEVFRDEPYVLLGTEADASCQLLVFFKREVLPEDYLKAWINAFEFCRRAVASRRKPQRIVERSVTEELNILQSSLDQINKILPDFLEKAKKAGWDLVMDAICTGPVRIVNIRIDTEEKKDR